VCKNAQKRSLENSSFQQREDKAPAEKKIIAGFI